jgi:(p)ppGpp synthase/HD superfamily hydrolase
MAETPTKTRVSSLARAREDLVPDAMRIAERAHRGNNHFRKAPTGEDRPAYFLHLTEVAWMLQDAGLADQVVAAGFLHDLIEDCGYTRDQIAAETGNDYVADLVQTVSEPAKRHNSWEDRNQVYLERMRRASDDALALSCADKTSNLRDMVRLLERGHTLEAFMSRGMDQQLRKFEALDAVFRGRVPARLRARFDSALSALRRHTSAPG